MNKVISFLFVLCLYTQVYAQYSNSSARIDNVDFSVSAENVAISYEILNPQVGETYDVSVSMRSENGAQLYANSLTGDVGKVQAGKHLVLWNYTKDNRTAIGQKIYAEINCTVTTKPISRELNVSTGGALARSLILPGWGNVYLGGSKANWLWSAAGYGLLGGALLMNSQSGSDYNSYKTAKTTAQSNSFYNSAQSKQTLALSLAGGAAATWAISLVSTGIKASKAQNAETITIPPRTIAGKSPEKAFKVPVQMKPADLMFAENSVKFADADGNNAIDANEVCTVQFTITNNGKGAGSNLRLTVKETNNVQGLSFDTEKRLGNLEAGKTKEVSINVRGLSNTIDAEAHFVLKVLEENNFHSDELPLNITVKKFKEPKLELADFLFETENNAKPRLRLPIVLKAYIQNLGQGTAKNVVVTFKIPANVNSSEGKNEYEIGELKSGAFKEVAFEFFANSQYADTKIPITVQATESNYKYGMDKTVAVELNKTLNNKTVNVVAVKQQDNEVTKLSVVSAVDKDIPDNQTANQNRFALIIGNEDYSSYQDGLNTESNVPFARNDAATFKEYAVKTLGVPEKNATLLIDANRQKMKQNIELVCKMLERTGSDAEFIFYYAGHGFPDESTNTPYLVPVDVSAANISEAIKMESIYKRFSDLPIKKVTVVLDACFSGGGRSASLIAARTVKIKPKHGEVAGNMLVFAATSGEQIAMGNKNEKHGMFTYFFLKKLQETKGNLNYGAMADYLSKEVSIESLRTNQKDQDPQVNVSQKIQDQWRDWNFK